MLKIKDSVIVHLFDSCGKEIKTRNSGVVFEVKEQHGALGIEYNLERNKSTRNGDVFVPFFCFSHTVIFENVKTGKKYSFSISKNNLEEVTAC